jgi:L-fuconolactonase
MIVDAHHHVWKLARGDYAWITPDLAPLWRDFDLAHYAEAAPRGIGASVLVQAAPTAAETRFLLEVARASAGRVLGVVGWVDLDGDDAIETLEELAREPLLRSVRPMLQSLPDPEWILRPRVQEALSALPGLGLRFDALVKPPQLSALVRMLERHPDLDVVIDHGGKPPIVARAFEPWATYMRAAAAHSRTYCKLSGLVTEAARNWNVAALQAYVDHLFECFGAGRMMWGSDWPVVELNGGIDNWWGATKTLLDPLDDAARAAVLGGNARRFYGAWGQTRP